MKLTTDKAIKIAQECIKAHNIMDEDLRQNIYLECLEIAMRGQDVTKEDIDSSLKKIIINYHGKIEDLLSYDEIIDEDQEEKEYNKLFKDLQKKFISDIIMNLLNSLPEVEQKIILERYYTEKSDAEICKEMNISGNELTKYHRSALEKLKVSKEKELLKLLLIEDLM